MRYIDADALLREIHRNPAEEHGERCAQILEAILKAPTANVVPREMYNRAMDGLKAVIEERAEDKSEVAREIFEEMDKIFLPLLHEVSQVYIYVQLKKKYTGDAP